MKGQSLTMPIYGLACGGGGALTVEHALERLPGVLRVYVNPLTEMAYVERDPVCGMMVDETIASETLVVGDTTYTFCSAACRERFARDGVSAPARAGRRDGGAGAVAVDAPPRILAPPAMPSTPTQTTALKAEKVKDPICGMVVDKATALKAERGGRAYYFCSESCRRTFESPEAELKSMRTRVTIALSGVLALAILRAGAFLALATGATIVTWAPIPALPWFTWGMWLFLLVTPVQFIGGWSFYKGAWNALRSRSITMDFLIALGTTTAYVYSVFVLFLPQALPVAPDQRDVYFEVSASRR